MSTEESGSPGSEGARPASTAESRPPPAEDGARPIMFDTLAAARRLKEAGFTDPQAEAVADAILETAIHNLATKAYIREYVDAALARLARLLTARLCAAAIAVVVAVWLIVRG